MHKLAEVPYAASDVCLSDRYRVESRLMLIAEQADYIYLILKFNRWIEIQCDGIIVASLILQDCGI